ncbi:MAG: nucleotidyl transferase AbiEii/AbiGii toxin family protein [Ardenticatenales bacterium]
MDASQLLDRLLARLEAHGIRYCVIGGQAVNAYADPLVSLDLDLVVASDQLAELESLLATDFVVQHFPHSLNVSAPGSDLRVQFQLDPRYSEFVERAIPGNVLGLDLPVAAATDVLAGKVWAVQDPSRRPSKRQKDLADIARLIETLPALRASVPAAVLERLEG